MTDILKQFCCYVSGNASFCQNKKAEIQGFVKSPQAVLRHILHYCSVSQLTVMMNDLRILSANILRSRPKIDFLRKHQKFQSFKTRSNILIWFGRNDRNSHIKCFDLVRKLISNPRKGAGEPECLKYFEKEVYSRRVNHKTRRIYAIYESPEEIDITSFGGHYE